MEAGHGGRRLALVVHKWGDQSTFFSWTWTKQYLLRRDEDGNLDPSEKLYIVKAGKDAEGGDRWKVGGPLVPDLDSALKRYPHTVVKLEGSVKSNIPAFLEQHGIDIMIVGDQWPQSGLQFVSVSDWVKQNLHCPFVIIRRDAVVNTRMKISSQSRAPSPEGSLTRPSPRTAAQTGRRIAIAYNSFAVGRGLMQFAKDKVLTGADTIYMCHVFSAQKNPVVKEATKLGRGLVRAMTLRSGDGSGSGEDAAVTKDNSIEFGAVELAGYDVQLNITLQGDPKSAISAFCESEEIELLVIGSRSGGRIRKKLGGGGVSSHLIDHAPCPCLVVPYRHIGIQDEREGRESMEDEAGLASPTSPAAASPVAVAALGGGPWAAAGLVEAAVQTEGPAVPPQAASVADTVAAAAASGGTGHSTPSDLLAQLQKQLDDKDRTIAELRQQVQQLQLAAAEREAADTHDPSRLAM